jgi:integrase
MTHKSKSLFNVGPNEWRIVVSVRVPQLGYPVRKQETFLGTRLEAEARRLELKKELKTGAKASSLKVETFGDAISIYEDKRPRNSKSAQELTKNVRNHFGKYPMFGFADAFERFLNVYKNTPVWGKKRKPHSTNQLIVTVRAVFSLLVDLDIVEKNPISTSRFPRMKEKARERVLTPEETLRLLNAIREIRPYIEPFVLFMLQVPCRNTELFTARKEQYNTIQNTIHIPRSKGGRSIEKPVPPGMRDYFLNIPSECPWLFYRESGGRYYPLSKLNSAWKVVLSRAGISDFRMHDLRHMAVTEAMEHNSDWEIADIAGWTTPNQLKTYRNVQAMKVAQRFKFKDTNTEGNVITCAAGG